MINDGPDRTGEKVYREQGGETYFRIQYTAFAVLYKLRRKSKDIIGTSVQLLVRSSHCPQFHVPTGMAGYWGMNTSAQLEGLLIQA
jgi:hypothetical protein